MKKKILALILCFTMALTFMPLTALAVNEETQKEQEQIVEVQPQQEGQEVNEDEGLQEENLEEPEENEEEMLLGLGALNPEDIEAYVDFRDEDMQIVKTVGYATLEEAIEACEVKAMCDIIRLNKDIVRDGSTPIQLTKGIELNGQGYTIKITDKDGYLFDILLGQASMGSLDLQDVNIESKGGFIDTCQGLVEFNDPLEVEGRDGAVHVDVEGTFIKKLGNMDDPTKNKYAQFYMRAGTLKASTVVESSNPESIIAAYQGTIMGKNLFKDIHGQAHFNHGEDKELKIYASKNFIELCEKSMSIMDCVIECLGKDATAIVMHGGTLNLGENKIKTTNHCLDIDGGTATISGENTLLESKNSAIEISGSAKVILEAGTFKGEDQAIKLNGGTLNIADGSFSSDNEIILQNGGLLNIVGGQFIDSPKGIEITDGDLVITNGNFKTSGKALDVKGGNANIYGGRFESLRPKYKTTSTISNTKGNLHVYNGIFVANGNNNCISVSSDDGTTTIDNGTFTANDDCVVVKNDATLNLNGGKYISKNANAIDVEEDSTAKVSTAVFETESYNKKVYAIKGSIKISKESRVTPKQYKYAKEVSVKKAVAAIGKQTYPSIDAAIAAARQGDTIKLLCDIEAYYLSPIEVNKKVTIDFNNHKISTGKSMFNVSRKGNLTLLNAQIETTDLAGESFGFFNKVDGKLALIDNNTYEGGKYSVDVISDFIETVGENAEVVIDGGAFKVERTVVNASKSNSKITVKNTVFVADSGLDHIAGELNVDNARIYVNSYGIAIDEGGKLVIKNSKVSAEDNTAIRTEGADAYIENVEVKSGGVALQLCGNTTIKGGKYTSSSSVVVDCLTNIDSSVETNIIIEDGEFVSLQATCIRGNKGNVTIKDGTFKSLGLPTDNDIPLILTLFGKLEIQDGVFEGKDIGILAGNSEVKIDGGEFKTKLGTIEIDCPEGEEVTTKVEISGGDFTSEEGYIVFVALGTAIINGGNFIAESNQYPFFNSEGNLIINDAYVESKAACVYTQSKGENTINGGIFKATDEAALKFWNDSTVTLSGGKFETTAKTAAIKDNGTLKFAKGLRADPIDWKEKQSQVIEVVEMTGEVIEGQKSKWSEGSTEGLRFRIDAPYEDFISVYVDGKFVDKANYTSWEGSTYVELKPEFLKTLSKGNHDIEFNFLGDVTVKTTFTVGDPKTADPNSMILWLVLLVMAAAFAGVVIFKFRQPKKAVASGKVIKVVYTNKFNK